MAVILNGVVVSVPTSAGHLVKGANPEGTKSTSIVLAKPASKRTTIKKPVVPSVQDTRSTPVDDDAEYKMPISFVESDNELIAPVWANDGYVWLSE